MASDAALLPAQPNAAEAPELSFMLALEAPMTWTWWSSLWARGLPVSEPVAHVAEFGNAAVSMWSKFRR